MLSRSARCIGAPSMPRAVVDAGERVQRKRAVRMHGLPAARHVRMELGDRGHEKLAAAVDGPSRPPAPIADRRRR